MRGVEVAVRPSASCSLACSDNEADGVNTTAALAGLADRIEPVMDHGGDGVTSERRNQPGSHPRDGGEVGDVGCRHPDGAAGRAVFIGEGLHDHDCGAAVALAVLVVIDGADEGTVDPDDGLQVRGHGAGGGFNG